MRRALVLLMTVGLLAGLMALPAAARTTTLDGPDPAIWIADPDGEGGIAPLQHVEGSSGRARVNRHGATISVTSAGLVPGHAYTMWIVYFNDQTKCEDRGSGNAGCNGEDLPHVGGGVIFGNGRIAGGNGAATFTARINTGDDAAPPESEEDPPPFAFAPYEAGPHNEFHIVIRSHGPKKAGEVGAQIGTFNGGCEVEVGPPPESEDVFPVPEKSGECGDVQVYVFS